MTASDLRFLADESCDFAVVRALRADVYDVLALCEFTSRTVDRLVIEQSSREGRILLTEDKDFGWLVFVSQVDSAGVILIRFPGRPRNTLGETVLSLVQQRGQELVGAFTVVQPHHIRISHPRRGGR